jgi:hypothetical protein
LPVMLASEKPPWVTYHNIVGVVSERNLLGKITEKGDGAVSYASAHLDDVESEIEVEADHIHVHQHPRAILEVRRILLEHSEAMFAEMPGQSAIPAAYPTQSELPPPDPRWPPPAQKRISDQPASAETMF